ncbi:plasmid mobilization relaxosome protein MobC [Pedobacter petrophilus]|uniref:Plasmid mobilization relaxosome protein MobC n=1 Tax=Pedobacter petrophilus TaxID=1908241 RepID=A0A7K0FSX5_9SPHI|nr:plasmid mobilization relaxosome protein MobC [Pedobacter petrophilus]MRX74718.1 plasmid mobilization relaxosome protein MobC [Pedobacter petrophilus]
MTKKKNGRPLKPEGKRSRFLKARVNEEEYAIACNLWTELGLKESDFLRQKILKPSSVSIKINAGHALKSLDDVGAEIGRSGNNINQLARHANALNKQGMLSSGIVEQFNGLFSDYIFLFREMEKKTRELLRLLKA